jgi:cyclophilin family peptidyl-prolyl cis-trans isomerase
LSNCGKQPEASKQYEYFLDSAITSIYDAGFRKDALQLRNALLSSDTTLANLAISITCSFNDSLFYVPLLNSISDSSSLGITAAFALGQQTDTLLYDRLMMKFEQSQSARVKTALLEAMAKSLPKSKVQSFKELLLQQPCNLNPAKAAFQAIPMLKHDEDVARMAVERLQCSESEAVLSSASYLSRIPELNLNDMQSIILKAANEADPTEMIYFAGLLKHLSTPDAWAMTQQYLSSSDERAVSALLRWYLKETDKTELFQLCSDKRPHIADMASAQIAQAQFSKDSLWLLAEAENVHVKAEALAQLIQLNDNKASTKLLEFIHGSQSPYDRCTYIRKAASLQTQNELLYELLSDPTPAVRTTALETILDNGKPDYQELWNVALEQQEAGLLAILASHVSVDSYADLSLLPLIESGMSSMNSTDYLETYNLLAALHNKITQTENMVSKEISFQEADFRNLANFPNDTIHVVIRTNKGSIGLQLYPRIAPATVSNFLKLADEGYYDNKFFHRVVPNFVIQAGCPRGDGWGSFGSIIRSEFSSLPYKPGAIGMASAGPDTESCQWFITHSHVPHLEGKYTIFGYVTSGMEIVRKIEVGDIIESVTF